MLINKLRNRYREITGFIEPVAPITTVLSHRPAANAEDVLRSDILARRHRRQRRSDRPGLRNVSGWTVSSW